MFLGQLCGRQIMKILKFLTLSYATKGSHHLYFAQIIVIWTGTQLLLQKLDDNLVSNLLQI